MIAQVDDTANFELCDLKGHPEFQFAITCKMCWSKNVLEERNAPDQILFGSMNASYCVLLALATYLEYWCETGGGKTSKYIFSDDIDSSAPTRSKNQFRNQLDKSVLKNSELELLQEGSLGTHSLRKFASTFACRSGCTVFEVELRGRWQVKQHDVHRYIDTKQPFIDAKVAAALCIGGAVKYKLVEGGNINNEWLLQHVVPNLLTIYPTNKSNVAIILALPLLWACLDPEASSLLPISLQERVKSAYSRVQLLPDKTNPVTKVPIVVYRDIENLEINELIGTELDQQYGGQSSNEQQMNILITQVGQLQ